MIIEVVLRLPLTFNATTCRSLGLIRSQIPESIILETWKLSLLNDGLVESSKIGRLTKSAMYEERRRFFRDIHICLEKLPAAKFARQVQNSQANSSPGGRGVGPEILLQLNPRSGTAIEKQFFPCCEL